MGLNFTLGLEQTFHSLEVCIVVGKVTLKFLIILKNCLNFKEIQWKKWLASQPPSADKMDSRWCYRIPRQYENLSYL